MLEAMRRPWVLLVSSALAGLLLGRLMSSLPAPSDVGTFWVGNFSSPWAVLAFLAGWSQRSRIWASAAGVAAEVACVAGFYAKLLFVDPDRLGLPRSTAPLTLIGTGVSQWLWFIAPWVAVAIGAGVAYGLLGRWVGRVPLDRGRRRDRGAVHRRARRVARLCRLQPGTAHRLARGGGGRYRDPRLGHRCEEARNPPGY